MLSKVVSSTIFKVFGMTRPGIEPRSPGPLANTLTAGPMSRSIVFYNLTFLITIFIADHHTTLAYYAYKSKLYFLRNAMMIFCSFVKTTTHTHTHKYIKKQIKNVFLGQPAATFWLHITSNTSRRQPQIYHAAHVSSYTHILYITLYVCTQ